MRILREFYLLRGSYLVLFIVKVVLNPHIIQDAPALANPALILRIKVRQPHPLALPPLLFRQSQIECRLWALILLITARLRPRILRVLLQPDHATARPRRPMRDDKPIPHRPPAPAPMLH